MSESFDGEKIGLRECREIPLQRQILPLQRFRAIGSEWN